mmetsp:Transcript_69454/g.193242  ORF Transcript_69454/g.193242 Transcript_69454/m.193242 type:complete len:300 (-) Transcript_69454:205-1104(-)
MCSLDVGSVMPFGDCLLSVGFFLSAAELAAAEQAQFFEKKIAARLYSRLSAVEAEAVAIWNATHASLDGATPDGKKLLHELKRLRRHFTTRKDLAPVVDGSAIGSRWAQPSKSLAAPLVTFPLAVGTTVGRPLAMGVRLDCAAGRMHKGWRRGIGVVTAGCSGRVKSLQEISFAPTSGCLFHRYAVDGPVMCADAMPPLDTDAEVADDVEAWIQITAEGGVGFFRRTRSRGLQSTGVVPRAALPAFVAEYYLSVSFMPQQLEAPTGASIIYCAAELPEAMSPIPQDVIEAVWHLDEGSL